MANRSRASGEAVASEYEIPTVYDNWLDLMAADDIDATLDIWSVALIAELKVPGRKEPASTVLGRLRRLSDEIEGVVDEDECDSRR